MTPREYMQKQVRGIAGGIAWTQRAFTEMPQLPSEALVDAAVDIAWERLKAGSAGTAELDITSQGNLIVFRPRTPAAEAVLS